MVFINDDGTQVRRKRVHHGQVEFVDQDGAVQERCKDEASGTIVFREASN